MSMATSSSPFQVSRLAFLLEDRCESGVGVLPALLEADPVEEGPMDAGAGAASAATAGGMLGKAVDLV